MEHSDDGKWRGRRDRREKERGVVQGKERWEKFE